MRWFPFLVISLFFYVLAQSGDVYELTSPSELSGHVLLRKVYSVVAFAIVGAAYAYARRRGGIIDTMAAVGLYSGLIEIGQWFTSDESLRWNLVDVMCGMIGGTIGAAIVGRLHAARGR
jgi:VanZ family protein